MANSINDGMNKPDQLVINSNASITSGADFTSANLASQLQAGTFTASSGSSYVAFDTAFASVPAFQVSLQESGTAAPITSATSVSGALLLTTSGLSYGWQALK